MQTREGATEAEDGDFVEHLFAATTHDYLMFFTARGRAYVEKVYEIPEMGRAAKGRSIANILELKPDEKIAATIRVQSKNQARGRMLSIKHRDENSISRLRHNPGSSKNRTYRITRTSAAAASSPFKSKRAIA
jgi:Type IIA topoisomerase (DNA gyrase/topo II, topoisomerase IV), A subunit